MSRLGTAHSSELYNEGALTSKLRTVLDRYVTHNLPNSLPRGTARSPLNPGKIMSPIDESLGPLSPAMVSPATSVLSDGERRMLCSNYRCSVDISMLHRTGCCEELGNEASIQRSARALSSLLLDDVHNRGEFLRIGPIPGLKVFHM